MTNHFLIGILVFTRDENFIYEREGQLMSEKPKNIVEGVGYGVKRVLKSIQSAAFGIITQPIIGAKQGGLKGFVKGTWWGVSGLIIKPVAGGFDFCSKTADGLKYNLKIFDEKNTDERIRWPRPFYDNQLKIKTYNSIDSYVLVYLNKIYDKEKLKELLKYPFIDSMILNEGHTRKILIFTVRHFMMKEMKNKNMTWVIDREEIEDIKKFKNGVKIKVDQRSSESKNKNIILEMKDRDSILTVEQKLKKLVSMKRS